MKVFYRETMSTFPCDCMFSLYKSIYDLTNISIKQDENDSCNYDIPEEHCVMFDDYGNKRQVVFLSCK